MEGGKKAGRGRPIGVVNELTTPKQDNEARTDAKLAKAHGTNRQYVADVRKIAAAKPANHPSETRQKTRVLEHVLRWPP